MTANQPNRPALLRSLSSTTSISKSNKPRLHIALYPRGGSTSSFTSSHSCDSYHWAIIVGPQTASRKDPGTRYHLAHASNPLPTTQSERRHSTNTSHLLYEENDILTHLPASTTLIRVTLAKVTNPDRLTTLLRSMCIPDDASYTCLSFVKDAFSLLVNDRVGGGCLKSYLKEDDWKDIDRCARKYCKKKRDQRRFTDAGGPWDLECVSTFNFWENRETTP